VLQNNPTLYSWEYCYFPGISYNLAMMQDRDKLLKIIKNGGDCSGINCKRCPLGNEDLNPPLTFCGNYILNKKDETLKMIYKAAVEIFIDKYGRGEFVEELI